MRVTVFPDLYAKSKIDLDCAWPEVLNHLTSYKPFPSKRTCPLINMSRFGDLRKERSDCLRSDENVLEIWGVAGDYDGGRVSVDAAVDMLEAAGIRAAVYPSASHKPDAPRWRVLAPTSMALHPDEHARLMARLNGALGGILAPESFTLSQGWYFGKVTVYYSVKSTFDDPLDGQCIDQLDNLDEIAIYQTEVKKKAGGGWEFHGSNLKTGDGRRCLLRSVIGQLDNDGKNSAAIKKELKLFVKQYFDPSQTVDWENIDAIINHFISKRVPPVADGQEQPGPRADTSDIPLEVDGKGRPIGTMSNVCNILTRDLAYAGNFWFDRFTYRMMARLDVMEVKGSSSRLVKREEEWGDVATINLLAALTDNYGFRTLTKQTVLDAVVKVSNDNPIDSAQAYLEGVKWDGEERVAQFLADCFGVEDNEYHRAASTYLFVGMVARIMDPGSKVDCMLVFGGAQGIGKSRAMAALGGEWFTEVHQDPRDKDFLCSLEGKMLIEVPELDSFNRAESSTIKRVLSTTVDRYRAPYEKASADHPRRCVFVGTTNQDDWQKDITGARRFLPISVPGEVRVDLIVTNRDQFFAEAVAMYQDKSLEWWKIPESAEVHRESVRETDPWEGFVEKHLLGRTETTIMEAALALGMMEREVDMRVQKRIARCMRSHGWTNLVVKIGGKAVRRWRPAKSPSFSFNG